MDKKQQKTFLLLILIPFIFIHSTDIYVHDSGVKLHKQLELEKILKKCAQYCERLSNVTLFFVCQEKITEEVSPAIRFSQDQISPERRFYLTQERRQYFTYVYDYQLIRKGGKIREKRILIEENGQKKYEDNVQLKTKMFFHKSLVLSPIDFLSKHRQQLYDYMIVEEKKYKGESALIISAVPKSDQKITQLSGKIWVSKNTFSIIKIEWEPISLKHFNRIEKYAKILKAKPRIRLITEYAFEKNGIRFPNKHFVREEYIRSGSRFVLSETTVSYENYKFFTVETEVKH